MRVFAILSCIAFVYANELDYKYRSVGYSTTRLPFTSGSKNGMELSTAHNTLLRSESSQRPVSYSGSVGVGGYETEFYTFTAPEDVFDDEAIAVQKIADSLTKKVRVIFIKNPENTAYENAALALIKQAAEQRTAIYVLNKQHNIYDLAGRLSDIRSNINRKPEVHFVKYRTPEDAYNAQRAIQGQYDSLGDLAPSYNARRAPDLNRAAPDLKTFHGPFQTPNEYLPPIYPRFYVQK